MKKTLIVLTLVMVIFSSFAFAKSVVVGSKMFTEGYIVSNMISQLLEENGFDVQKRFGLSSLPIRKGMETGQIDIYPEYTGTAWAAYFKKETQIYDPVELFNKVNEIDKEEYDIVWLDMINFNNTYGLAVRQEFAEENNINSLSDLSEYINNGNEVIFGVNPEYYKRSDGIFAVIDTYNMNVDKNDVKTMEAGLTYTAVESGNIDVAMVYSTDALILKHDLKVLNDDKNFFPLYYPSALVRQETLEKYPEIKEILKPLTLYLNESIIIRLNYLVDVEGLEPAIVSERYLEALGLIK
ncbi:MAG: glycine betaine ABC transporter substrate-binding protein [Thermotogota bacterium]